MGRARQFPKDTVLIQKDNFVVHRERAAKIRKVLDPELVLIEYVDTNETATVAPWDLQEYGCADTQDDKAKLPDLGEISDEEFDTAKKTYEAIKPLLEMRKRTRADVSKVAEQLNVQTSTVYDSVVPRRNTATATFPGLL